MKEYSKKTTLGILLGIFILCGVVKDIEFMYLKTDQTILAENVICKLFCIGMIATVLALLGMKWRDLGFVKQGCLKGLLYGFSLGIVTFAVSYLAEYLILLAKGLHPHLGLYITNFSMSELNVTGMSLPVVLICIAGNLINVWAEEGLFRGLFQKIGSSAFGTKGANMIQSLLFGIWHAISLVLWVKEGSMTVGGAVLFGIGYLSLAWILGYEWGICAALTGTVWVGFFEHFFNNFISNALHMVTDTGIDELQALRIVISNVLSLTIVLIVARRKKQ